MTEINAPQIYLFTRHIPEKAACHNIPPPPYSACSCCSLAQSGIAHRTTTQQLFGWRYDDAATQALGLASGVDGAAFRQANKLRYVVWAKTNQDLNETTSATISLAGSYTAVA